MAENPSGLQVAGPDDFDALMAFALPIFEEDAVQPLSLPKVAMLVARCLQRDRAIAGILRGPDGKIEGSVGATIDQFDYTDDSHIMVRWFGVAPDLRRTDRSAKLLNYVRWLFEILGAHSDTPIPVLMPTLITTEHEGKARLYQRKLPQVGALFALGCLPDRTFYNPINNGIREALTKERVRRVDFSRYPVHEVRSA